MVLFTIILLYIWSAISWLNFRGLFETPEGSCEACDGSCLTCDGIKSKCLSCADGHYLESGSCGLNCSLRTYPADDGTCRRCPPHCDVCSDDRTCFSELLAFREETCPNWWHQLLEIWNMQFHPPSISLQNALSFTWCWTACVRLVVPWAISRIWRKADVLSATLPVAAVQGPW